MARLLVKAGGRTTATALDGQRIRLGSSPDCEICVEHPEIGPHVANIELRGQSYFFQNLNAFQVYVGQQPIAPEQWVVWPLNESLKLTRNVTLSLAPARPGSRDDDFQQSELPKSAVNSKKKRQVMQLAALGLCALVVVFGLGGTEENKVRTTDSFQSLIESFAEQEEVSGHDRTILLTLLQAAHPDSRLQSADGKARAVYRSRAILAYETLIKHPRIRGARMDRSTFEGRVKLFAEERLSALNSARY